MSLDLIFEAGLPVFLLTFVLVYWALRDGRLAGKSVKELQAGIGSLSKPSKSQAARTSVDPALERWLRFGGGFYGLIALYTWLLIEWEDVATFIAGLADVLFSFEPARLFSLVLNLFIESIMNFVVAIGWPAYWLSKSREAWLMLGVAYASYWLAIKAAQLAWQRGWWGYVSNRILAWWRRTD